MNTFLIILYNLLRFIGLDEIFQIKMAQENVNANGHEVDPSQQERQQIITGNLTGQDLSGARILEYQNKAPAPPEVKFNSILKYLTIEILI